MNKQSVVLPGPARKWGSYISKYQPDSSDVLDNMFTANSKNFITDQTGMIDKRQGGVQWNRTNFGNVAKDTYEAVFESGARHFLRVGGGTLYASTGTGLFDVITTGYSTLGNFEWVTYQNRSYGDNGVNAPQTYDNATSYGGVSYSFTTAKTKIMGAQAPTTAPTSSAYTSGGAVPVGSHRYKITFQYYESEESNGSPASAVQTATGGTQTGQLSSIPIGGYGVTGRNIYRDNNDGVYLLLDTIPDNTTTTYTDTLLIGSTPTPLPLFNDVPPTFTKIALWLDSIFIAPAGETNTVRFSNAGEPDVFDPNNFIVCQSDDVITALYVYNGKLYVFGLHSFGSIEGNTPDTFYYHNISNLVGCVDNRSIQVRSIVSVPTMWWLSDKGFYFSNGNTVEYGSDFIQDLVNLNLAQVNYSAGKNTQSSFADFSGDTSSEGIDLSSNPGAINLINPEQSYSSTADWLAGLSLTNLKTTDSPFLEVPTQFTAALGSGVLSGQAQVSGSNVTLPQYTGNLGETQTGFLSTIAPTTTSVKGFATNFTPEISTVLQSANIWSSESGTVYVFADAFGFPGGILFSASVSGSGSHTVTPNISLIAGTKYWLGFISNNSNTNVPINPSFPSQTGTSRRYYSGTSWSTISTFSGLNGPTPTYDSYVLSPVVEVGTWISPVYDSGGSNAVSAALTVFGTYPSGTTGSVTVYASTTPNMASPSSQTISSPNGMNSLSLSGFQYWQVVINISTTNSLSVPLVGTPTLTFNTTGTWISQPIHATTDNTGWGTLTYTGNAPGGTSVTLLIATSANNITYSSFGPIGSAVTQPWAKVQAVLTTDAANITSPSVSSITLTWNLTSQIESSPIDTGTTPSGFGTMQWELSNTNGTTTFYIRTASTSAGLSSASYVAVLNGAFPNLTAQRFVQWKLILTGTADNTPEITSVTVNWFVASGSGSSAPLYLGSAGTFAVLGKTAVTNTGSTVLTGDLGNVNASSISGFPPGTFSGTLHSGNAAAATANTDATSAFTTLAALPGYVDISAVDLGSHTLTPGYYSYSSSATWTAGALTLNAGGNANAVWVIKTGSTLITPSAASVILTNGAQAANVYWIVGSSATLGTTTTFKGNIIANVSITCNTGATCDGSLIALTGAVSLDTLIGMAASSLPVSANVNARVASIFFNKTYYISVATTGATANNTLIQLDQFGNWRIQKDTSISTFLSYFNTLYFTDGITDKIFNGFTADTDDGVAIVMDVRTKAWSADNDLFLKVPRAFKVTGINTGTTIHAYYSNDRGATWIEMLNEQGTTGFTTDVSRTEFVVLFVPNGDTLTSGRTLMFRLVSDDTFPCSILNYVPSFYSRKGRYLSNG